MSHISGGFSALAFDSWWLERKHSAIQEQRSEHDRASISHFQKVDSHTLIIELIMALWIDIISLVLTTLFFVGAILGVLYAVHAVSTSIRFTKASLEARGITLSRDGFSLKTQRRFDRDAYLDATRGLVKVLGAATIGSESNKHAFLPHEDSDKHDKHTFSHLGIGLRRS
ncbi:hypothetical protein V8E55_008433 [Tylopilus felleus]